MNDFSLNRATSNHFHLKFHFSRGRRDLTRKHDPRKQRCCSAYPTSRDSITYGYAEASGNSYRRDIEYLLYTEGNPTQLIGSIKNGNWQNNDNNGFSYHNIDEIGVSGTPEIAGQLKPNVVLLHAGTNDMVRNLDVANAPTRLGNLIGFITSNCPDALVVVAQLIPNANATVNPLVQTYNNQGPSCCRVACSS